MSFIRKRKRNGRVYLEEVENVRIDGKVVQKHLKYIGREADNQTVLSSSISNISIDHIKLHGPLLVLNYFCKKIGLSEILGEYGDEILSLVFAHCIDYKSVNQMPRWFERTDLNMLLNLDDLTEDRLLRALDSLEAQDPENIQKRIFEKVNKTYQLNTDGLVYDVTNTYLYGKKCPIAKLGKDKDGVKGRPLIQIGLGVTKKDGIPVFHKVFDGNISDSRTLSDLVTSFKSYKVKFGLIIYDRGIASATNIQEIKKLNLDTICGIASNNKIKTLVKKLLSTKKILDMKRRIKLNESVFYIFPKNYVIGKVKGILLICYNDQKAKDLRESRRDEIQSAQELISQGKRMKSQLEKYFHENGGINYKAIDSDEELDGFSFIFSTKKMSADEIVRLYFHDKDIIEKAFQNIKGIVKVRPIRHWLYNRVVAHIFICYLSYLLLSLLKLKLKKINMSPIEALQELDTLYKVYIRDKLKGFKLEKTVALTRNQEKILKTIDKDLLSNCSG